MSTMPAMAMRLERIQYAADQSCVFEFRADGARAVPGAAGSHIEIALPGGLSRAYSIINPDDDEPRYLIAVKHAPDSRGGSRWLHDSARVGMKFDVSPPRNNFALDEAAPHSVLFAGGIGITPMWSMVQRLERLGAPWTLHYGVRRRCEMLFARELAAFGDRVQVVVEEESAGAGRFIDIAGRIAEARDGAHVYCCGPAPMMQAFEAAAAQLPEARRHVEYFSPKEEAALEGGFTVQLARRNMTLAVPPGRSILDVLVAHGVDVAHSCEQGVCGSCETRVLEGTPDHRDSVLTQGERDANNTMMVCCSGSKGSRLVLDL